jgi:hypothetical protein
MLCNRLNSRLNLLANLGNLDWNIICNCRSGEPSDLRFRCRNRTHHLHRDLHRNPHWDRYWNLHRDLDRDFDRYLHHLRLLNNHRVRSNLRHHLRLFLDTRLHQRLGNHVGNRLRFRAGIFGACHRNCADLSRRCRISTLDRERLWNGNGNRHFDRHLDRNPYRNFLCDDVRLRFLNHARSNFGVSKCRRQSLWRTWFLSTSDRLGNDFDFRLGTHDRDRFNDCRRYGNRNGFDFDARTCHRFRYCFDDWPGRTWSNKALRIRSINRIDDGLHVGAPWTRGFVDCDFLGDDTRIGDFLGDEFRYRRDFGFVGTMVSTARNGGTFILRFRFRFGADAFNLDTFVVCLGDTPIICLRLNVMFGSCGCRHICGSRGFPTRYRIADLSRTMRERPTRSSLPRGMTFWRTTFCRRSAQIIYSRWSSPNVRWHRVCWSFSGVVKQAMSIRNFELPPKGQLSISE